MSKYLQGAIDQFFLLLLFDKSGSMFSNNAWNEVARCFERIASALDKHPTLRNQVQVSVCGFGVQTTFETYQDFTAVSDFRFPEIPNSGGTFLYEAYSKSIAKMASTVEQAGSELDIDPNGAWVMVFSDYQVTSPDIQYQETAIGAKSFATENEIDVFNFMCGSNPNESVANELSQDGRPPVAVETEDFARTFSEWVVDSLPMVTTSQGRKTILPPLKGQRLIGN